ncbi:MAG TPA: M48 family metalloprotease [Pyrinomonadaceae bacterium]|jgi:predicted Zn-dependent protease|nr:M48 family metalloprotease [Pyrinomonadaceae bacterium]
MLPRKPTNLIVAALCVSIVFTSLAPVAFAQKKTAPVEATPPPVREEFKFGEVDLEVLEQADLLDTRFERDGLVLADEAANAYLRRVGQSLIPRDLKLERVSWKFRALRDPQPNAFALPNGSIYVTTGLMTLIDNESQLAAIIAHELTHVMRRHTYVFNRSNRKKFLTINVMAAVGAYAPGGIVGAVISIVTAVAPFMMMATIFGYSRDLEREADRKGIDMMISAEYAPEEMVNVMKLLDKDLEGENIRLFYNDHPALDERIKYLSNYLGSRADRVTHQMELNRERTAYFQSMEPVMRHNVQLAINAGRARSAVYFAQRLVDFHEDSENLFWLAESYRTLGPRAPELTEKQLTNSAMKDAAKKRVKRTLEEEERELLATPAGQENWQKHQQKAEELYKRSLSAENPAPVAHRGLGMLYEKLGRGTDAVAAYEKYLELSSNAIDRERIQRRVAALKEKLK